jgi:hypothetical protein
MKKIFLLVLAIISTNAWGSHVVESGAQRGSNEVTRVDDQLDQGQERIETEEERTRRLAGNTDTAGQTDHELLTDLTPESSRPTTPTQNLEGQGADDYESTDVNTANDTSQVQIDAQTETADKELIDSNMRGWKNSIDDDTDDGIDVYDYENFFGYGGGESDLDELKKYQNNTWKFKNYIDNMSSIDLARNNIETWNYFKTLSPDEKATVQTYKEKIKHEKTEEAAKQKVVNDSQAFYKGKSILNRDNVQEVQEVVDKINSVAERVFKERFIDSLDRKDVMKVDTKAFIDNAKVWIEGNKELSGIEDVKKALQTLEDKYNEVANYTEASNNKLTTSWWNPNSVANFYDKIARAKTPEQAQRIIDKLNTYTHTSGNAFGHLERLKREAKERIKELNKAQKFTPTEPIERRDSVVSPSLDDVLQGLRHKTSDPSDYNLELHDAENQPRQTKVVGIRRLSPEESAKYGRPIPSKLNERPQVPGGKPKLVPTGKSDI